jgi:hypothetical protein
VVDEIGHHIGEEKEYTYLLPYQEYRYHHTEERSDAFGFVVYYESVGCL